MLSILMDRAGIEVARPWGYRPGVIAASIGTSVNPAVGILLECAPQAPAGPRVLPAMSDKRAKRAMPAGRAQAPVRAQASTKTLGATRAPRAATAVGDATFAHRHLISGSLRDPLPD